MSQDGFNQGLCGFLQRATTPFHAVAEMASQLSSAGFKQLSEDEAWHLETSGRYFLIRNQSSIVAFTQGTKGGPGAGMRMVGAHTDSPCLMVKPEPELNRKGYFQLAVQVYGGALLNPWFDRDLSLAGRVSYRCEKGRLRTALIDFMDPVAIIPSLAIHLDRDANKNRTVNPQKDVIPVLAQLDAGQKPDFRALLKSRLLQEQPECAADEILDFELSFYDTQAAALVGLNQDFIASARLDNLLSCYTGLRALIECEQQESALLICSDHEEVGSMSASGAQGPLLRTVLERLSGDTEAYARLVEGSMMISADNAHGVHPNFADRHDDNHGPLLNGGPVIKINANQRYATNSETGGLFRMLCAEENVPVQSFVVRNDMACGSTIGPITASVTGVRTLDIGVPTFAMHSIRELAGARDANNLFKVMRHYFDYSGPLKASVS